MTRDENEWMIHELSDKDDTLVDSIRGRKGYWGREGYETDRAKGVAFAVRLSVLSTWMMI